MELFGVELLEKATAAASRQDAKVLQVCHIKEAVDAEPLFDFLREIVSECPGEQHLPSAPRKQKSAGDGGTEAAPKRQKAAGGTKEGKAAAGSAAGGASSSTAEALAPAAATSAAPIVDDEPLASAAVTTALPPLAAVPSVSSDPDLFGGSRTLEDDGDDYDAE